MNRDVIAAALLEHQLVVLGPGYLSCRCGEKLPRDDSYDILPHRLHVADAALAALGGRVLSEDLPENRQYGRRYDSSLVLATAAPDPTHYRLNGPWRPIGEVQT